MHVLQGIILPVKKVKILNMSFVPLLYALIKIFFKNWKKNGRKREINWVLFWQNPVWIS